MKYPTCHANIFYLFPTGNEKSIKNDREINLAISEGEMQAE